MVLRGWHISVVIWSLLQLHKLSLPLKLYVHERLHRVIILSGPLIRNGDVVVSEILAWLCYLGQRASFLLYEVSLQIYVCEA